MSDAIEGLRLCGAIEVLILCGAQHGAPGRRAVLEKEGGPVEQSPVELRGGPVDAPLGG